MKLILLFLLLTAEGAQAQCGIERWPVKTLTDADTSFLSMAPVNSRVSEQAQLPKVKPGTDDPRKESEKTVYNLGVQLVKYKLEDDGDLHLVLKDIESDSTMVAEIPNPECPELTGSSRVPQYREARQWLIDHVGTPTTGFKDAPAFTFMQVIGVGYYDILHGQTGMASNGREIHPVLSLKTLQQDAVNQVPLIAKLSLAPNPASQKVQVSAGVAFPEIINFAVLNDFRGTQVYRFTPLATERSIWNFSIPTGSLANGPYFLQIYTTTAAFGKQIIIQH